MKKEEEAEKWRREALSVSITAHSCEALGL
jgi:hypothetical protein